jgi:hypothetical protein
MRKLVYKNQESAERSANVGRDDETIGIPEVSSDKHWNFLALC